MKKLTHWDTGANMRAIYNRKQLYRKAMWNCKTPLIAKLVNQGEY